MPKESNEFLLFSYVPAHHHQDAGQRRYPSFRTVLNFGAFFYGDGMIMPAISVLSTIENLEVATPDLQPYVVPVSVIVLVMLFVAQSRGSGRDCP